MELRYKVDVSAAVQVFEGLSQRAGDPEPILKRWGGYFRWKAGKRQEEAALENEEILAFYIGGGRDRRRRWLL